MDKVRIGVLGAGRGAGLAMAMRFAPSMELAAICDANQERLAQAAAATGVAQTYTTYEAMLDADIDAVLVASPMPLHVAHSIQALQAGKHVLSEVTAATSIEQCWELVEAVKASGRKYMLAENYCYIRPWSIVLGMVRAGLFGELYYGEADQLQELKGALPHPDTGYNWRTAELAMRRGHQYITHNLGPLYWAFGERIQSVACQGSGQHHLEWARADDTCVVLLQTVSGKLIRIRLDFFSDRPMNVTYYGLQGTEAAYEGPRGSKDDHKIFVRGKTPGGEWQSLWDYREFLAEGWKRIPPEMINDNWDGGNALMLEDFARCIIEDTRPPVDVIDAVNLTAPGLLSEISREQGGIPVAVPDFTTGR
ncbi:MAG: Gfo/Idh/MocA family oxidoreductase [Armatimonadetes bacterium]|jgi:predicted dehydrogenase|nr:Gfo/Idh/MocA family oxidoreductase [Armatimonadota bacterium]